MKILKFREFFENASPSGSTAGSGDVSNPQVGTQGSGDIPFYLKRSRRRKMGNPSQVSDLRDLKPEKINRITDF